MKPFLIAIAGPSGAGKSVFCRKAQNAFKGVTRLKLDDFFKDECDVPKLGDWTNWDDPSALKWDQLLQAARDLSAGRYAIVPNYSRMDNCQIGEKCVFSSDIILVDGFMSLHHPELRELIDLKLYFDLSEDSQITRRKQRQPWVEDGYLHNIMLPAARKFIMPTKEFADHIINAEPAEIEVAKFGIELINQALENNQRFSLI